MIAYLDTSVLVPMLVEDALTPCVDLLFEQHDPECVISDFGRAEFVSAVAKKLRNKDVTRETANSAFYRFDLWVQLTAPAIAYAGGHDIFEAEKLIRRLDVNLRTPDAIHIAVAIRFGVSLASFDKKLVIAARSLGVPILELQRPPGVERWPCP